MYSSHYLAQAKRDLFCTPTPAFQVQGLQTCATIPDQIFVFLCIHTSVPPSVSVLSLFWIPSPQFRLKTLFLTPPSIFLHLIGEILNLF